MANEPTEDELRRSMELLQDADTERRITAAFAEADAIEKDPLYRAFMEKPLDHVVRRVLEAHPIEPTLVLGDQPPSPSVFARISERMGRVLRASRDVIDDLARFQNGLIASPVRSVAPYTRAAGGTPSAAMDSVEDDAQRANTIAVQVHDDEGARRVDVQVLEPLHISPVVNGYELSGHYLSYADLGHGEWWWALRFKRVDLRKGSDRTLIARAERVGEALELRLAQSVEPSIAPRPLGANMAYAADEFDVELVRSDVEG